MVLFNKKRNVPNGNPMEQNTLNDSIIQQITLMKKQGYQNQQIVQLLAQKGYTNQQIYDAFNKAEAISNNNATVPSSVQMQQNLNNPVNMAEQQPVGIQNVNYPSFNQNDLSNQSSSEGSDELFDQKQIDKIEELTEAIIDERWNDLMKNIQKIVDWKNRSEERIVHLEKSFSELQDDFKRLELAIVGRIKEYDENLQETLGNVKALNVVFKQILPQFTVDVKRIHSIVDELKGIHKTDSKLDKKKSENSDENKKTIDELSEMNDEDKVTKTDKNDSNDLDLNSIL